MAALPKDRIQWVDLVDEETLVIDTNDGDRGNYQRFTDRTATVRDGDAVPILENTTTTLSYTGVYDSILIRATSGTLGWRTSDGGGGSVSAPPASSSTPGILRLNGALGGTSTNPTALGFASASAFQTYLAAQIAAGGGGTPTEIDGGGPSSDYSGSTVIDGGGP